MRAQSDRAVNCVRNTCGCCVLDLQYPHFSCTTTGSSLNHLWRELDRLDLTSRFQWSIIDRWPTHTTYVDAIVSRILDGLLQFPEEVRHQVRGSSGSHQSS